MLVVASCYLQKKRRRVGVAPGDVHKFFQPTQTNGKPAALMRSECGFCFCATVFCCTVSVILSELLNGRFFHSHGGNVCVCGWSYGTCFRWEGFSRFSIPLSSTTNIVVPLFRFWQILLMETQISFWRFAWRVRFTIVFVRSFMEPAFGMVLYLFFFFSKEGLKTWEWYCIVHIYSERVKCENAKKKSRKQP